MACDTQLTLTAIATIGTVEPGDDIGTVVCDGIARAEYTLRDQDVVLVTSKIVSRAEGRFVDLSTLAPSSRAQTLAAETDKDPRLVELILSESRGVSRKRAGALIVVHRLGFVSANAAIDASNAAPTDAAPGTGPWVLTMPEDPDASAAGLVASIAARFGVAVGVVITDSHGRPFRLGTMGQAVGVGGMPALADHRGERDRFDRELEFTTTAVADQLAAAADLVAGQSGQGRPVVVARGLRFGPCPARASDLHRDPKDDLYV